MPKTLPMLDTTGTLCCSPVASGAMDESAALEVALRLKALADPTRLRLMSLLMAADGGEVCTCDLAEPLRVTEATTSHHLGQLKKAGLATCERRGMNVYYRAVPGALKALSDVLDTCC